MKKITQFLFIALMGLLSPSLCWAVADPAVTGAAINPSPITAPTGISASFVVANNGTTTSSAAVKITISLSLLAPGADFNIATSITGTAASRFTWVYDPLINAITGTLNSAWIGATGGTILISNLVATAISQPGAEANGINVNVVAPGAVNSSTTNDNTNAYTSSAALPVTLISFNAKLEGPTVNLTWATTEETNSDRFEIERSLNGKSWGKIGTVASGKESNTLRNYTFTDASPSRGENLYRLKMVDQDETFAYSSIRNVVFADGDVTVSVSPNPVADLLFLKDAAGGPVGNVREVAIINMNGLTQYKTSSVSPDGINVKNLASGVYIVKVTQTGGALSTHKIVVNR